MKLVSIFAILIGTALWAGENGSSPGGPLPELSLSPKGEKGCIADGGFESGEVTVGWPPETPDHWQGDLCEVVGAQEEIIPLEGARMLRFIASWPTGPTEEWIACNVWQLVDPRSCGFDPAGGGVTVTASAAFNKIKGDEETDRQCLIWVYAYDGEPETFPLKWDTGHIADAYATVFLDDDPSTWERVSVTLPLPAATDFIAVMIAPLEDVYNDSQGVEFDGHFADDVRLTFSRGGLLKRGDVDADGKRALDDAVFLLRYLFVGGKTPPCLDAADAGDDGKLNVTDAITLLLSIYGIRPPLPFPYGECGSDPTEDGLDCLSFPPCETDSVPPRARSGTQPCK